MLLFLKDDRVHISASPENARVEPIFIHACSQERRSSLEPARGVFLSFFFFSLETHIHTTHTQRERERENCFLKRTNIPWLEEP